MTNLVQQTATVVLIAETSTCSIKIEPADLKLTDERIPPKKLARLGSKKWIDPEALTDFSALKKEAERLCLAVGTRILRGRAYSMPLPLASELNVKLLDIGRRWDQAKLTFEAKFDHYVDKWLEDPEVKPWAHILRGKVPPVERVLKDFTFQVVWFGMTPIENLEDSLSSYAGQIGGQVIYELGVAARQVWEKSFRGKDAVGQKAINSVRALQEKLEGLAYLDRKLKGLLQQVNAGLAAVPTKGKVDGAALTAVAGVLHLLNDASGYLETAVRKKNVQAPLDLGGEATTATPAAEPEAPVATTPAEEDAPEVETPVETLPEPQPTPRRSAVALF